MQSSSFSIASYCPVSHSFFVFELTKEHHELFEISPGKNENKIETEQCLKFEYDDAHAQIFLNKKI